jgi:PPOX class probable F420-dependent enzyme
MFASIPDSHKDLLEGPVVVALVTVMPDGQPQATPVWCNTDGTHVLINTARGRQKDRNLQANPRVTVLAIDPQNPYRWIEIRGIVTRISEEGALDHINTLSKLYTGSSDFYAQNPQARGRETRVIYEITPVYINMRG